MKTKTTNTYERFRGFDPATVFEAAGKVGMVDPAIRAVWPGAQLCGPALTLECDPGDNLMLHLATAQAQPGTVLVATINNDLSKGAWGEVLTVAAQQRGIQGLVIDGAVRDSEAIKKRGFPVFSRGLAIGSCSKEKPGALQAPINLGGVRVHTGDLILGDGDGLVVVRADALDVVYTQAEARQQAEAKLFEELAKGKTTLELLGLEHAATATT